MAADNPELALKIVLDKPNPEIEFILYLITLLLISTIIYLYIQIAEYVFIKCMKIYSYFNQDTTYISIPDVYSNTERINHFYTNEN